ncbi:hypothetical protein ACLMJK_003630 [Lecanora helva]
MANPETSSPRIRACLFDMDGLLLDTEDLYNKCNNIILHEYGRPNIPWKVKAQMQGRPGPEAAAIFHAWAQLPLPRSTFIAKQAALQAQYFPFARPLPGVPLLLKTLKRNPSIHLALATSSHARNFKIKSQHHQGLFSAFAEKHRILGDDARIPAGRGKPAPDIYLLALETINRELRAKGGREIKPGECLVFEDSVPGVEAGRRAGMQVVWCPHPMVLKEFKGREREVLAGIANGEGDVSNLDDGWAVLVETLEGFDYGRYGIEV